jgi:hypothetical protein
MATVTLETALEEIQPVPDSALNLHMSHVIGNKLDTIVGDSLVSLIKRAEGRLNNQSKVYPSLANGVDVITGLAAWDLGLQVEIVPAGIITSHFLIFYCKIEAASATDVYEIVLYAGAGAGTEIGRLRTARNTAFPEAGGVPISTEIIDANSRISVRIANAGGGNETVRMSIHYVELD